MKRFQLTVYDGIFNHKAIQVPIGLAGLIRLRSDGWFTAYFDKKGNFVTYYFIAWCGKCGGYFLVDEVFIARYDQSELCPICNGGKKT